MRNIKGTLLDISSEENIIKLIFNNDIKKHSLRDSFSYSNFKNATFLNYQEAVSIITEQEKIFLLFEGKDKYKPQNRQYKNIQIEKSLKTLINKGIEAKKPQNRNKTKCTITTI